MRYLRILFVALNLCSLIEAYSQGCSDAGGCSLGGLKAADDLRYKMSFMLNTQYGVGEQNVKIYTPQLEYTLKLGQRFGLQAKLPYVFASGNLGSNNGFGDPLLAGIYKFYDKRSWALSINLGFKTNVNHADRPRQGPLAQWIMSLPMPYQTSLGTTDLLGGIDAKYKDKWILAAAIQWPVINRNYNSFDTALVQPSDIERKQYFTSAQLLRRPDAMLRIDRRIKLNKTFALYAGVLPIYHLGHDRFTDAAGVSHAIHGSKGLTLNITSALVCNIAKNYQVTLRYATPAIVRKVRPDGLTRHYVFGLELKYYY